MEFMFGMCFVYLGKNDFKIEIIGNIFVLGLLGKSLNLMENFNFGYNYFGIKVENIEFVLENLK